MVCQVQPGVTGVWPLYRLLCSERHRRYTLQHPHSDFILTGGIAKPLHAVHDTRTCIACGMLCQP